MNYGVSRRTIGTTTRSSGMTDTLEHVHLALHRLGMNPSHSTSMDCATDEENGDPFLLLLLL